MKILDIIVEQHAYTVTQFALNVFESFSDYRRWSRGPKTSKRGATRYSVDKYENIFVLPNALHESHSTFAQKKQEARVFSAAFSSYDERDTVEIAVGNSLAVLSATLVPGDSVSRIEISGFVQPKRIVAINLDANDRIDTLEFSDGSIFPEAAEFTTVGGTNITNTIFFSDATSASRAYTAIWMQIGALEHNGWTVESAISESRDSSLIERKRKRKRSSKSHTVYGGWWGGYYGDNSSAEGGGEGVSESTLSWSTLSESLSVEDKLTIFEEYHCKNTLLESNSESSVEYFKSLFELSDDPVPNKKYIVVPLMLVSDRIMQLDSPSVMKYVGSKNEVLIFTHANVEREYPPTTLRHRSLSHTFTFATRGAYDKFRIALRLKFDVELSNVNKSIDEASSAAQQAAIAINMRRAGKKPQHNK